MKLLSSFISCQLDLLPLEFLFLCFDPESCLSPFPLAVGAATYDDTVVTVSCSTPTSLTVASGGVLLCLLVSVAFLSLSCS